MIGKNIMKCLNIEGEWIIATRETVCMNPDADYWVDVNEFRSLIEECSFEGVTSNLEMGIYVQGAVQNLEVKACRFRQCDYAIEHGSMTGGNGPHFFYNGNFLEDAKMLNSNGLAALGHVCDNFYETAKATTGTYDAAVDTLISQGINFSGNHYAEAS